MIYSTKEKLAILGAAAKYDASCSSSGSKRQNAGGLGNAQCDGICHSWGEDGRCISLLKVLQTNICQYDCKYCINRKSNDTPRAFFSPSELANLTLQFYRRNYIEGLFLSSAVFRNVNYSMELMLKTVSLLRNARFGGYIHLKVMPACDPELIQKAGLLVDRLSANIELPSGESLKILAPQKNPQKLLGSIKDISKNITINKSESHYKSSKLFAPAGQSTQLIIGATNDTDRTIINLSQSLYNKLALKRVYYSAYVPVVKHTLLPDIAKPPLLREHRLYQADWLLRFYGFSADEILPSSFPHLDMRFDPKSAWAIRNYNHFPLEINKADYEEILRIPGVGVTGAKRIVHARKYARLDFDDLKKMGIVLKRAKYFTKCNGKMLIKHFNESLLLAETSSAYNEIELKEMQDGQLPLFQEPSIFQNQLENFSL